MGYFRDPTTGQAVYVDDKSGKVQLRDSAGAIHQVDPSGLADALASQQYAPATAEDVAAYDAEKKHGGLGGKAKTFAESAAAGAYDAATAPVRVPLQLLAGLADEEIPFRSGREVIEDVTAVGTELGNALGLTDRTGEAVAREYSEEARERALTNPGTALAGRVAGEVAGGFGLSGAATKLGASVAAKTGSAIAGRAAAFGTEGALLAPAQTSEDLWLQGRDPNLTAEQLLGSVGYGALLGGTLGAGVGATERGLAKLGERMIRPAELQEIATRVLGEAPSPKTLEALAAKLNEPYSTAASALTGAERSTVSKYGIFNLSKEAKQARRLLHNSDEILESATKEMTEKVDELAKASRSVFDEVTSADLKMEHIRPKLTGTEDIMRVSARAEARALREGVNSIMENAGEYGNRELAERVQTYVSQLADQIDRTDDMAEAFIALDRSKRGLQRWTQRLRTSGRKSSDALQAQQSLAFADRLDELQESTRQMLMDNGVWGAAADDQRAINQAWEEFFESKKVYEADFLRQVENADYHTGLPTYRADPKKVASYVRNLGRQEGRLTDEYFRAHLNAIEKLSTTIGTAFDTKVNSVAQVKKAAEHVRKALGTADETVKVVNQVEAIAENEAKNSIGSDLLLGGILGGAPGALIGAAANVVTKPAGAIKKLAAIESMVGKLDGELGKSIKAFFKTGAEQVGKAASKAGRGIAKATESTRKAARRAAVPAALAFSRDGERPREAYRRHAKQILSLSSNPERAAEVLGSAFAPISGEAPQLTRLSNMKALNAVQFLASKLPVGLYDSADLQPHLSEPTISDSEIAKFARYWSAVTDPLSVLRELKKGTLTSEHTEALRAVWPALYDQVRGKVAEEIATSKERVPYAKRKQLDLLLDLNGAGEPTLDPGFMLRFEQALATAGQGPQQEQASGPKLSGPVNIASDYATEMDRIEGA